MWAYQCSFNMAGSCMTACPAEAGSTCPVLFGTDTRSWTEPLCEQYAQEAYTTVNGVWGGHRQMW